MTLTNHPPHDQWHNWTELDAKAWPKRVERNYTLIPTTCFNCEAACGLVAFIDKETGEVVKFEETQNTQQAAVATALKGLQRLTRSLIRSESCIRFDVLVSADLANGNASLGRKPSTKSVAASGLPSLRGAETK